MIYDGFNHLFNDIKEAIRKDLKTLPKEVAEMVKDDSLINFYNESFDGNKWAPHKEPVNHSLLHDTGALLSAVRHSVDNGRKLGPYIYQLNIASEYGIFHNEGTSKMPQRQFIGLYPALEDKLLKHMSDALTKHFEQK